MKGNFVLWQQEPGKPWREVHAGTEGECERLIFERKLTGKLRVKERGWHPDPHRRAHEQRAR